MIVSFKSIENNDGSIKLNDLYKEDFTNYRTPFIEFTKADGDDRCWDNSDYLLDFFRGLKKNKKKQIKELKKFCKQYNYEYEFTLEDLLEIYSISKKLKFWKK